MSGDEVLLGAFVVILGVSAGILVGAYTVLVVAAFLSAVVETINPKQ